MGASPIRTDPPIVVQAKAAARSASLRYVSDTRPGIQRQRSGNDFAYLAPSGKPLRDSSTLKRIASLVIPPAWTKVWICPDASGHLQATGYDARNRKQYRYHPRFREIREATKYHRIIAFARALPHIRRRVAADVRRTGLPREKVLAAIVRLLEVTLIRVGNDQYANSNKSFGLTTLRDHHARIKGHTLRFTFKGKSGVPHDIDLTHPRLAKIVKQCQELPGQELLQYLDDDGKVCDIGSADVNDYLRQITAGAPGIKSAEADFTAKDFRTWAGTVLAAMALREVETFTSQSHAKKNILRAVERVAAKLGNTKAVCRKCYIHPAIFDAYLDGSLIQHCRKQAEKKLSQNLTALKPEEAMVLTLLRDRLSSPARSRKAGQNKQKEKP